MKYNGQFLIAAISVVFFSGCISGNHVLKFDPSFYAENSISVGPKLMQPGVVYTLEKDDAFVYQGKADSYIGRNAIFDIPVGKMVKEIAIKVMSTKFKKGVIATNTLAGVTPGSIIIRPAIRSYVYRFRMGMTGLYVIPQVEMVLNLDLVGPGNKVISSRKYKSGLRNGEAFLSGSQASDTINKLTHETLFNLLKRAARDLENILKDLD